MRSILRSALLVVTLACIFAVCTASRSAEDDSVIQQILANAGLSNSGLAGLSASMQNCSTANDYEIVPLFDAWNSALATLNATKVAEKYWNNAVLLATVTNEPRNTSQLIYEYFVTFLTKQPQGRILSRRIYHSCNISADVGTYLFTLINPDGSPTLVPARYTYVYEYRASEWKILHHHSSAFPETTSTPAVASATKKSDDSFKCEVETCLVPAVVVTFGVMAIICILVIVIMNKKVAAASAAIGASPAAKKESASKAAVKPEP
jgi:hypothetical protein